MKNILYYGSGSCTIETTNIVMVAIYYKGAVTITDKTSDNYQILAVNNNIVVFPILKKEVLSELFDYIGELEITSVVVLDIEGKKTNCSIKKVMDYSEQLQSKSEDLTVKSEDINAGFIHKQRVPRTAVDNKIIKNLHSKGEFYKEDGNSYTGACHVHTETHKVMTGGEHSSASEDLYIKKLKTGKLVLTGKTKKARRSAPVTRTTRMGTSKTGGY